MALQFLNQSRSFDQSRSRVRFLGHDGTFEIRFLVEADALLKLNPEVCHEEGSLLCTFDAARTQIQDIAAAIYKRNRDHTTVYVLAADDF